MALEAPESPHGPVDPGSDSIDGQASGIALT